MQLKVGNTCTDAQYWKAEGEQVFDYIGRDRRRLRERKRAFSRIVDNGDVRVFVDHGFQWDGSQNVWLTRARASYVVESGPVFELRPRALLARVTGFLGGASSGDPCFDDFFCAKTAAADATWAALTTRARSLLASHFEDARLVSDGTSICLWREGDFGLESDADIAVEVVSEIARFENACLAVLRALPGAQPFEARGPWTRRHAPGVTVMTPTPVHLEPHGGQSGACMQAWSECGRGIPKFAVSIDGFGRMHGDSSRIPEHARFATDNADGLGACAIACNGQRVWLRWPTLKRSRAQLLEGARLVASLSQLHGRF
tara:strand:- start:41181 stop:42128 length:948 start_codon:yes stop_codon:yes gene_type:complete